MGGRGGGTEKVQGDSGSYDPPPPLYLLIVWEYLVSTQVELYCGTRWNRGPSGWPRRETQEFLIPVTPVSRGPVKEVTKETDRRWLYFVLPGVSVNLTW